MFLCIQQIHIVILRVQVGFLVRKYLQVLKRHRKLMSEKLHGKSLIQHICIKLLHTVTAEGDFDKDQTAEELLRYLDRLLDTYFDTGEEE